jgi:hypothetical protein
MAFKIVRFKRFFRPQMAYRPGPLLWLGAAFVALVAALVGAMAFLGRLAHDGTSRPIYDPGAAPLGAAADAAGPRDLRVALRWVPERRASAISVGGRELKGESALAGALDDYRERRARVGDRGPRVTVDPELPVPWRDVAAALGRCRAAKITGVDLARGSFDADPPGPEAAPDAAKTRAGPDASAPLDVTVAHVSPGGPPCAAALAGEPCADPSHWRLLVAGVRLTERELGDRLVAEAARAGPAGAVPSDREVRITADPCARYGRVAAVVNLCEGAGMYRIDLR